MRRPQRPRTVIPFRPSHPPNHPPNRRLFLTPSPRRRQRLTVKLTLSDLDHPLVFLFFLTLALIPIGILVFYGARKVGAF